MASPKKTLLLETALQLFNENGFHNTGIDMVQSVSGVSKTTMYKYFPSKESLIIEVLKMRHDQFEAWFRETVNSNKQNYVGEKFAKLYIIFDALTEWFHRETFFGCNFINASAEFADEDHPVHRLASDHKQWVMSFVKEVLDDMNVNNSEHLALQISLLMDGAIVCAHTVGQKNAAEIAKNMMDVILKDAT